MKNEEKMAEKKPPSEDEVALVNGDFVSLFVAAAVATGKVIGAGKVVGTIVLGLALGVSFVAAHKLTLEFLKNNFC